MSKCQFFIGNDTGTIHMAAAAGLRCLGIYAAHDLPGLWSPYGQGHIVLRNDTLECAGCKLIECPKNNECINSVLPSHAFTAVNTIIKGLR